MNVHTFLATGAGAVTLQLKAQRVYYRSASLSDGATNDTIIITNQGGSEYLILRPGQGCDVDQDVSEWLIYNASGLGSIKGQLIFGRGAFIDNRMSGTVDVVDGGKARTFGGSAMIGFGFCGAVAAQHAKSQLWNPAGSGKILYVEQISAYASGASANLQMFKGSAALPVLAESSLVSKRVSSSAGSAAQLRTENTAVYPGQGFLVMERTQKFFKFSEPLAVEPGYGVMFANVTVGDDVGVNWEFFEEAIPA